MREYRVCGRCRRENQSERTTCWDCGTALRGPVLHDAPPVPPARPPGPPYPGLEPPPVPRACPVCAGEMQRGIASLIPRSRWSGVFGWGWLDLVFSTLADPRGTMILHPLLGRGAARCLRCGGLWIAPSME